MKQLKCVRSILSLAVLLFLFVNADIPNAEAKTKAKHIGLYSGRMYLTSFKVIPGAGDFGCGVGNAVDVSFDVVQTGRDAYVTLFQQLDAGVVVAGHGTHRDAFRLSYTENRPGHLPDSRLFLATQVKSKSAKVIYEVWIGDALTTGACVYSYAGELKRSKKPKR